MLTCGQYVLLTRDTALVNGKLKPALSASAWGEVHFTLMLINTLWLGGHLLNGFGSSELLRNTILNMRSGRKVGKMWW